ncbi:tyrosine-type recombinase/integrase [Clostridium cibarium]|uniref:Tyrosine-type recombinase/integrase n=1 Tax=Clostridium cibarium TaxID=2762247 RepID=A0ABR8PPJ1_9CLOT|nr:tyrosine-type recombinase/integrase [Clostridium cibarium]MBD7910045.1 tyrosine-type recombinase/integrase [Clostridium cibarium]
MSKRIDILKKSEGNISLFGRSEGLNQDSIRRIFIIVINYLRYLITYKEYKFERKVSLLISSKDVIRILKANGIYKKRTETVKIDESEIILQSEYELLLKNAKAIYAKLLFYLLYNTGMRIGEALGLKIKGGDTNNLKESLKGDVEYKDGRWLIKIVYRDTNENYKLAKAHRNRSIYLKKSQSIEFEILLEKYLMKMKRKKNSEWLFLSSRGTELTQNTAYKYLKSCLDKANLSYRKRDLTLHSFRHTFITKEIGEGTPIVYASLYVGHKNLNTTIKKYVHLTALNISEIREKYDEFLDTEFDIDNILTID